jgi:hypothetical protein
MHPAALAVRGSANEIFCPTTTNLAVFGSKAATSRLGGTPMVVLLKKKR